MKLKSLKTVLFAFALASTTNISASSLQPVGDILKKSPTTNVDGINYKLDAKKQEARVIAGKGIYNGEIVIPDEITVGELALRLAPICGKYVSLTRQPPCIARGQSEKSPPQAG